MSNSFLLLYTQGDARTQILKIWVTLQIQTARESRDEL